MTSCSNCRLKKKIKKRKGLYVNEGKENYFDNSVMMSFIDFDKVSLFLISSFILLIA